MTATSASGGARRAAAGVISFVVLAAGITAVALVAGSSSPAAAAGLARFSSCAELEGWTEDISSAPVPTTAVFAEADEAVAEDAGRVPSAAPGVAGGEQLAQLEATADGDTGGTNTVVAGVDEIDIIDRVGEDRLLVSRNGALALVDLAGRVVVAELADVPYDARISVAGDTVWVAGSSPDGIGTLVRRVRLQGDALVDDGSWSTPGWLLDARRTGDRLHVVAVDQPYDTGVIPFEGGSVPCEEMWHPTEPATTPAATLVASLPAEGALEPTATAAVTGSAGNLLVTDDSVYLATETWSPDDGQVSTGLHRFDLATLTPTGSGSVPGAVAGRFAMDEHDGHLRVATSEPSFEPIALDGGGIGGRPASGDDVMIAPALPAEPETTVPETTVPETTTSTTAVDPTTTGPEPPLTTIAPETTVVTPEPPVPPDVEAALAEVFVLDTDGDLDIVGRTGRFGHDFETIQGVRFVGDVAYVVTFLQTDPFWVIDLADPANPTVVGELAIPGFSAYLHPLADGRVVGFGPDGAGSVSARLFDVTDPTNPAVLDEIALGDDSPIVWDAHAYVTLDGDRFAVPVSDWPDVSGCVDVPVPERPTPEPLPDIPPIEPDGSSICEPVLSGGLSGAVVLGLANDRLVEVERASVETDGSVSAERVVLAPDGTWLLLSWDRLVPTDGADHIQLPVGPNTGGVVIED